jgi:hypothetical protein
VALDSVYNPSPTGVMELVLVGDITDIEDDDFRLFSAIILAGLLFVRL